MKLPTIKYVRPEHLADALEVLAEHGDEARPLAGGQSLIPLLAMRLCQAEVLVDIGRVRGLPGTTVDGGLLVVGAATTARAVERNAEVDGRHPLVVSALGLVGHPEIRNRTTVCGSLAHADPAAELPAVLLATDGAVQVAGLGGIRRVTAAQLCTGPYTTALQPGEVITAAEFPLLPPTAGWSVLEIAQRHGDFAVVGVVAVLDPDERGICRHARIVLFGLAATPLRAFGAEGLLVGRRPSDEVLREAARASLAHVIVTGDLHGSAAYRRRAGAELVHRALVAARSRTHDREAARG